MRCQAAAKLDMSVQLGMSGEQLSERTNVVAAHDKHCARLLALRGTHHLDHRRNGLILHGYKVALTLEHVQMSQPSCSARQFRRHKPAPKLAQRLCLHAIMQQQTGHQDEGLLPAHLWRVRVLGIRIGGVQEQDINADALQRRGVCHAGIPAHVPRVQQVLSSGSSFSSGVNRWVEMVLVSASAANES